MKKLNKILIIVFLLLMSCSHKKEYYEMKFLDTNNLSIRAIITNMDYNTYLGNTFTSIIGHITVVNYSNDSILSNLKKVKLSINNEEEGDIAINSFADIIILDKIMSPKDSIAQNVCWTFKKKISIDELKKMKLIISKN
ncbi:MAG: hypothetical protein P4L27_06330 [Ignavibacteriaceae bacterium]|nr:hypothetical protein [Ignavibacteriaceae bacterium]